MPGVFPPPAVAAEHDRISDRFATEPEIAADGEVAEVTPAHRSVPFGPDLAGLFVRGDAVVEDDVGIGDTAYFKDGETLWVKLVVDNAAGNTVTLGRPGAGVSTVGPGPGGAFPAGARLDVSRQVQVSSAPPNEPEPRRVTGAGTGDCRVPVTVRKSERIGN